MTTFTQLPQRRESFRRLVLNMAVGLIALAVTALACGPAAPASPDTGETATNATANDQLSSGGADPFYVPQQASGDGEPTPMLTICADTVDGQGNPIKDCGPPPPMGGSEHRNIDGALQSLVEGALKAQLERGGGVVGADSGGQEKLVPTKRYRVQIQLTHDTDGRTIIAWLEERGYSYTDYRDKGKIFAGVELTAIPDLSEVEGVFRLTKALENVPG